MKTDKRSTTAPPKPEVLPVHATWRRSREEIRKAYRHFPDVANLFADFDIAVEALREIARPALGGKMQQYRAQRALARLQVAHE